MKYILTFALIVFIMSCDKPSNSGNESKYLQTELAEHKFTYDIDASSNFIVNDFVKFNNDTIVVYDYWALIEQPEYKAEISNSNDTIHINWRFRI